jgi:aldose 1-epimerase
MPDTLPLILAGDGARAEIFPALGGALGRYDVRRRGDWEPIFQTAPGPGRTGGFALGCNVLVPFSNRISGGGFSHDGVFHGLEPNVPGGPLPIHGNAFQQAWTVEETGTAQAVLSLDSIGPGPFRYRAELTYALRGDSLEAALSVRNMAGISLPYGVGLHPWFVRTPQTRLTMAAAGFWGEDAEHLPTVFHPGGTVPAFDFAAGARLPDGWINNAFTGWNGRARIAWPDRGLGVEITATPPLTTAIVYSPSAAADFVCFEPVSHSVDAHNRTEPGTAPPQVLAPGEVLNAAMTLTPCGEPGEA